MIWLVVCLIGCIANKMCNRMYNRTHNNRSQMVYNVSILVFLILIICIIVRTATLVVLLHQVYPPRFVTSFLVPLACCRV